MASMLQPRYRLKTSGGNMPHVYIQVDRLKDWPWVDGGNCVSLINEFAPGLAGLSTQSWRDGARVLDAPGIARGTAIATFENGRRKLQESEQQRRCLRDYRTMKRTLFALGLLAPTAALAQQASCPLSLPTGSLQVSKPPPGWRALATTIAHLSSAECYRVGQRKWATWFHHSRLAGRTAAQVPGYSTPAPKSGYGVDTAARP